MKKRKPIFVAGVILTIIYSLLLAFSVIMVGIAVFGLLSIKIVSEETVGGIVNAGNAIGQALYLIIAMIYSSMLVASIILLISSTRFIKYASESNELFKKKKFVLVLSSIFVIIGIAGQVYYLLTNTQIGLNVATILQIALIVIEFICVILAFVSMSKEPSFKTSENTENAPKNQVFEQRPSIYTSGLDDEEEIKKEENEETKEPQQKIELKETTASKQLVDAIGELDKMRKEGAITPTEYTRLRGQLIKKYIK